MTGSSIRFKRGNKANLPQSASSGTPLWCEDSKELYVGTGNGVAKVGVVSNDTDTSNVLYPIGVKSNDTSVLKKDTSITMQGGTLTAQTFIGDFSGNATSATKATKDGNGNIIANTYLPKSGGTVTGTLDLTKTTDLSGTANNSPALRIGNVTGEHLELDGNEIHSKASATTVSPLNINIDGGDINFNSNTNKVSISNGNVTASKFTGSLAGNANTATSAGTVSYKGTKIMNASGTANTLEQDAPDNGIAVYGTYNDSNTPTAYGNIINVKGGGAGQLLLGWSGNDKVTDKLFYRSHRDTGNAGWGAWKQIAYTDSNISGTAAKATADADGNTISSSYYKFQGTELGASTNWDSFTTPGCYKVQNATMTSTYNAPVGEYSFGLLSVLKSAITHENRTIQIYYPHNNTVSRIWTRMLNGSKWTAWVATLSTTGTAAKATADANGNRITETYATKNEIAGLSSYQPPLLFPQWYDHILNDVSWLRADTYTWHNGTTYSNIYNELLNEYNNENSIEKQLLKITQITLPTFTSNTTSNITVSDSRENADSYTLINGVTYKPIGAWETYWFNINYNRDTFLNSYSITADNNGSPEYPTSWVLNGSNDGETWVTLDEKTGQSFSLNQTKTYTVNCRDKYKQYRLVFASGAVSSGNGELGRLSFNADQVDVDINYKLTPKGYKIANVNYENRVAEKYEFDGISWFYVIDTQNQQFKLPRTKFGFKGFRSNVGDDIEESLPNITGGNLFYENGYNEFWGAIYNSGTGSGSKGGLDSDDPVGKFDASRSSSTYKDGAPVQERATQMYLYFYIGQYTKSAIEQTAGLNSELINTKVDISSLSYINPIVESFVDGTSGYNIWANGLCEQWGQVNVSANSSVLITLLKRMLNTGYFASGTNYSYFDSNRYSTTPCIKKTSDSQITVCNIEDTTVTYGWYVKGYLANGEY